jgi:hypothetical protein
MPSSSGLPRPQPAMDFLSASDANLAGLPYPEVIALAAVMNRVLVSLEWVNRLTTIPLP